MVAPACLILRPGTAAEETARRVAALGWRPVVLPSRTVELLDARIAPRPWQAITVTSAKALHGLARMGEDFDPRLKDLPVLAVGDATAAAARQLGWLDSRSAASNVAGLCDLVLGTLQPLDGPVLYPRGRVVAGDLEGCLSAAGFSVDAPVVYETRRIDGFGPALRALLETDSGSILVHAPSAARDLADAAVDVRTGAWTAVCISPAVAEVLAAAGWAPIAVAASPDEAALLASLSVDEAEPPAGRP